MKRYLLLLVGLTIISCSKDDDSPNENGRTTDPLIGTWVQSDEEYGESGTIIVNSNGSYSVSWIYRDTPDDNDSSSGTWSNRGSDFNSTTQIYDFTNNSDGENYTETVNYSEDFNSHWETGYPEETWTRQ